MIQKTSDHYVEETISYLRYANPFYHLTHLMRRYLVALPPLSHAVRFYIIGHHLWHDANPNDTVGTPSRVARNSSMCQCPPPRQGEGRCFCSDFLKEIWPKGIKAFIVGVRIEQPRGRRDTA